MVKGWSAAQRQKLRDDVPKLGFKAEIGNRNVLTLAQETLRQWRKQLLEELPRIFTDRREKAEREREELESELYKQIGKLKVELEWLKKKVSTARLNRSGCVWSPSIR